MEHIRQFPIYALLEPSARLMGLCLALVNASIWAENQNGDLSAKGLAEVELPNI